MTFVSLLVNWVSLKNFLHKSIDMHSQVKLTGQTCWAVHCMATILQTHDSYELCYKV